MNKILQLALTLITFVICLNTRGDSQEKKSKLFKQTELTSDELVTEGKDLDNQILEINKNIQDVISKYKLLTTKDIRIVPYRIGYKLGENYIEIEKCDFKREPLYDDIIIGIKKKLIRVYVSGQGVSKIESEISEKEVGIESYIVVKMIDPSPTVAGTDDIVFSHTIRNKKLIDEKKLGEIRNNRIFPVRNTLKRDFLIPHITFCYNTLLNIAEAYYKGIKDSDKMMADFLKKSTRY